MGCGSCASAGERCGNGLEKIYPTTAVRYGKMRHIGEFSHPPNMKFACAAKVVIVTDRGIEMGEQVSLTCFGCSQSVSREQMKAYAQASGGDTFRLKSGRILREATESDLAEWARIQDAAFDQLQTCRRLARGLDLPMKIVDTEHLFGGERLIFYFMADERIDFRQLVQQLAREFQTRIEMRQVGARDEARLVADYETCGRECCCKSFLKTLKPISMSMAKLQKTTLDLSKVSGRCGRLKCCLRYEHETYESLDSKLPRLGVRIRTAHGVGQIIDRQILTQLVKIRTDDEKLVSVVAEDILEVNVPAPLDPAGAGGAAAPEGNGNGQRQMRAQPLGGGGASAAGPSPASRGTPPADNVPPAGQATPPANESREPPAPRAAQSPVGYPPAGPQSDQPPRTGSAPDGMASEAAPDSSQRRRTRRGRRRRRSNGPGGEKPPAA